MRIPFPLLALLLLCGAEAYPANRAGIAQVRQIIHGNQFTTDRDLADYAVYLGPRFLQRVDALGPRDHLIDVGAGAGRAVADILLRMRQGTVGRARITAITVERPHRPGPSIEQEFAELRPLFRFLVGRYIEQIPLTELKPATVITDVQGAFHYTERPDLVLQKYLDALAPGGHVFTHLPVQIRSIEGDFAETLSISDRRGAQVPVRRWLERIEGVELLAVPQSAVAGPPSRRWVPRDQGLGLTLRKTAAVARVPKLELDEYAGGSPPRRSYRLAE